MQIIKKIFKKLANKVGIQLSTYSIYSDDFLQLTKSLEYFDIDLVLDVGANEGQFAKDLINYGYKNKIISFEPIKEAHQKLLFKSKKYKQWIVHPRCAVGNQERQIKLNISNNSVSSSLLDLKKNDHSQVEIEYLREENVIEKKLETLIFKYSKKYKNIFLKIDVQGYEDRVIEGCGTNINLIKGIFLETSTEEIYFSQKLWDDIIIDLLKKDFKLWFISKGIIDLKTNRNLQNDFCLFKI